MNSSTLPTQTKAGAADFRPFQAWRYDPARVDMNQVIAPPYDIISPAQQEALYKRSPYNCVRLILNKILETDTDSDNRYTRAKQCYDKWREENVVVQEKAPCFYLYRQTFIDPRNGKAAQRTAILGRLHLEPFEKEIVIPHEKTLSKPRADRRKLFEATASNFSPVFGLYEDLKGEIRGLLNQAAAAKPIFEAVDDEKVTHTVWAVSDPKWVDQIRAGVASKKIYIADGHHRYQTALEYGADRRKQDGNPAGDQNYDFVLTALVEFNDPGLVLLPTHRVLLPYPALDLDAALKALEPYFKIEAMSKEALQNELSKCSGTFKVVLGLTFGENKNYFLTLQNLEEAKKLLPKKPEVWYTLDVNILAHLIFKLWKLDESQWESVLRFTHHDAEAFDSIKTMGAKAAFLLKAPPVTVLRDMGAVRELMPQKSTYFQPKLASGLVFYSH